MKIDEIRKIANEKGFTFIKNDHNIEDDRLFDKIIRWCDLKDNVYKAAMKKNDLDPKMKQFYIDHYRDVQIGEVLESADSATCWNCGYNLYFYLTGDREITMKTTDKRNNNTCEFKDRKHEYFLDINSNLIFKNFFKVKEIYETEDYCSINEYRGRKELTQYLNNKGVGYFQFTNTCVSLIYNKTKNYFLITDTEYDCKEGEKKLYNFCLDVWRLQFAPKDVLEKYGEKIMNGYEVEVEKGIYRYENYYEYIDTDYEDIEGYVYAKIEKV